MTKFSVCNVNRTDSSALTYSYASVLLLMINWVSPQTKISEFIQNGANIVSSFSRFMTGYLKGLGHAILGNFV